MTDICIDENSPEQRNLNALGSTQTRITNDSGIYTLEAIEELSKNFERDVIYTEETDNPIKSISNAYGEIVFYESVSAVNILLSTDETVSKLENYPTLQERQSRDIIITPFEVAMFTRDFGYTPTTLVSTISSNPNLILFQLNSYYTRSFTQSTIGSFCALAPSIFAIAGGFFTALDQIGGFLRKIQNVSVASLLSNLKNQVIRVIDGIISKVRGIIENFSISSVVGNVETFVNEQVIVRAKRIKDKALSFFSEENIERIKARIKSLVDYAINIFKNPDIDEIQYLIYRFCGLAAQVEGAINQVQSPLISYASDYSDIYNRLAATSGRNTTNVIRAGGLRYDPSTRRTNINNSREMYTAAGNPAPIAVGEVDGVTSWNNGRGDSRISFGPGLQQGRMGEEGWIRVDVKVRVMIMRVQRRFGKRLQINSGYRSPAYNRSLNGAARRSLHMQGMALDVTWSGFNTSEREEFIRIAREEGFRGIGRYNSFVHVDIGPERNWSSF